MDVVTGASGLLGNVLVKELLKNGRKVRVLIRKTSDITCFKDCDSMIEKQYGDLLDLNSLVKTFEGAEHVYHVASEISILPKPDINIGIVNLNGTRNVIEACKINKVKRLIYTSSIHIFKDSCISGGEKINEDIEIDLFHPLGMYNRSKAAATLEVLKAANSGLDAVILCPTAILGPYDYKISNLGSLIINHCKGRQKIIIDGAYDFVDVRDVAEGHICAANMGKKGNLYILSGQRVEIPELMNILSKFSNMKRPILKIPYWIIYPVAFIAPLYYKLSGTKPVFTTFSVKTVRSNSNISHEKATAEFGYSPRPIEQTLMDTINWFKEEKFF